MEERWTVALFGMIYETASEQSNLFTCKWDDHAARNLLNWKTVEASPCFKTLDHGRFAGIPCKRKNSTGYSTIFGAWPTPITIAFTLLIFYSLSIVFTSIQIPKSLFFSMIFLIPTAWNSTLATSDSCMNSWKGRFSPTHSVVGWYYPGKSRTGPASVINEQRIQN